MSTFDPSVPTTGPDFAPNSPPTEVVPDTPEVPLPPYPEAVLGQTFEDAPPAGPAVERVGRGLLFALVAIAGGVALTVILWQLGFVASVAALVMAAGAVWMYTKGAGSEPRRGVPPLIGMIIVGILLSIVAAIASDAVRYLTEGYPDALLSDKVDFVIAYLSAPDIWSQYTFDIVVLVAFAALGAFSTFRRLSATTSV